jgi:hypothetical protein
VSCNAVLWQKSGVRTFVVAQLVVMGPAQLQCPVVLGSARAEENHAYGATIPELLTVAETIYCDRCTGHDQATPARRSRLPQLWAGLAAAPAGGGDGGWGWCGWHEVMTVSCCLTDQ